jgi:large subunit ribosomal protein L30e
MSVEEIRKIVKEGKAVIGTKEVLKGLKLGKVKKVFITRNCPLRVKKDIKHYAEMDEVEVVKLKQPNDELGVLCKKPYSISVLGLKGA